MHTAEDDAVMGMTRGYELWLATEAKKRNPSIKLGALAWTAPKWVGGDATWGADSFCDEKNVKYTVDWLLLARSEYGLEFDFIGLWNERPVTNEYERKRSEAKRSERR
jgi:hypothetical protein